MSMIHDESNIANLDPASSCPICRPIALELGIAGHKLIKLAKVTNFG